MSGKALLQVAPRQDLCIFCAIRLGKTSQRLYRPLHTQKRSFRTSTPSKRPPAAAYAVAEDQPDEPPQSSHQPSPPPPKPSPSAWPVFVPKRPLPTAVEPPPTRPPEDRPSAIQAEPPSWKCSSCGSTNLPRRNKCQRCQQPKSAGPVLRPSEQLQRSQPRWGNFLSTSGSSTAASSTYGGQKQQPDNSARSISEPESERPIWRHQAFTPRNDTRTTLSSSVEQAGQSPFTGRSNRQWSESDRRGKISFARNQDREPTQEQQPSQSRERQINHNVNVDTGDRSGLDALLQHSFGEKNQPPQSRRSTEGDLRVRRVVTKNIIPEHSTGFDKTTDTSTVSETTAPETVITIGDSLLGEDEEDSPRTRKDRRKSRFHERAEDPESEEARKTRGRIQSDLDEPQIAATKVEPRQQKKAARRASSQRSDYFEDPDEDLLSGRQSRRKKLKEQREESVPTRTPIQLPEFISVENLARALRVRVEEFLSRMEDMGFEKPRHDHVLDAETSGLIASEFNFEPIYDQESQVQDLVSRPLPEDVSSIPPRPPIVTIMGHVDHGKTTILDWLRKSSVAESEHGGITQHIGAFSVKMPGGKQITFLDTPGHAAFLDMRRRGATVTDIVILVVAADDSVKPQTLEAIKHATDAKVPMIVAINKVDKEDANVERVKQDLARHGVTVEDYGGDVQAIPVSGKFGKGMEDLEEATVTLSELLDHRAEVDGPVEGWIIESKVTIAGRVATVLVRRGTLRPGDIIVAGTTWARIRTLRNDAGLLVNEALPGTPVQIDGWRGDDPIAGWEVLQAEDEDHAKDVVDLRKEKEEFSRLAGDTAAINAVRAEEAEARAKVLAWEAEQEWASKRPNRRPKDNAGWVEGKASGGPKQVHFVVKADVSGSVEAVVNSVSAIGNNEIAANVIRSGVGVINESDVQYLASSGEVGYLISFNQPVEAHVSRLAEAAGVGILDHNIIYKVTDAVKEKLTAELPPIITQRVVGEAEISKIFEIGVKKGKVKIAGCKINNGIISRDKKIRVSRGASVIYDGSLNSLKNVKKDVTEMRKGSECGMGFENWEDFQEGDQIQCYEEQKTARTL